MAETTERLMLQVDAATELLRRHLAEGEQPLDRFERRVDQMADRVERSIGGMGSRFSAFGDLADDAAKRAQKSFEASFSQVQRVASQAIKGPTIDARVNLGVDDLRSQAAAAQDQARSFELIAAAAERATGGTRHASEASYLFIQATNASRIEAEQKAAALLAEAGALERVQIELMQSAEATEHFVTRHQRIAEAAEQERQLAITAAAAATEQRALAASADLLRTSIDPMYAAQQRFDQEMSRAETLLRAGAISQREYATATDMARKALNQQATQLSGSAAAAAQAVTTQERLTNEAFQLRAALDPMFVAQQRFDQELDRADRLFAAGAITAREYTAAIQMARDKLYEHARALPVASAGTADMAEEQQRAMSAMSANRMAMQGLSYQAQDTFTQLSMGANVFSVVAIQGAQAAGQLSFMQGAAGSLEGRLASLGKFMLGGWGLGITAALMVIGALTKGMRFFGDETEEAIEKLKKDAHETDVAAVAKERFAATVDGVAAAIRDQHKALVESAKAETDAAERAYIDANAKARQEEQIRKVTAARLADAIAARRALDDSAFANSDPRAAALARRVRDEDIARLRVEAATAEAKVMVASGDVQRTRVDLAAAAAKRAVDPLARINKLYDDQARAIRNAARAAADGGAVITSGLTRQLTLVERNRAAALKAEQDRQNAARSSGTANRQFGREVDVAGATAIVAGIGGRVTSGLRSTARQAQLYAAAQAGTHVGPVAKPGTSAHERGSAIDVAYGPGISVASIKKAFADAGVSLRKVLDEPTQRVFHVEYGKAGRAGPSAETLAKREERARVKVLRDDNEFAGDVLQARRRLLDATTRSAGSEEQRDQLLREEINAEADTAKRKLENQVKAGELTAKQAEQLSGLNEATRQQRLQNVKVEAATRLIDRQYQARADQGQSQMEILRLQQGMATTDAERERVGREILDLEQQLRRAALERIRDTSGDVDQVQDAKDALGRLPALERAENDNFDAGNTGQIEQYRQRLIAATSDMDDALQGVAVRGFGSIEDGFVGIVSRTQSVTGAFKSMAASIVSDLARIAIQRALLSAIPGGFLGFSDGGEIPGFAAGGSPGGLISGPGTGTSDSILALLSDGKGPIRVSAGEFIMNARATQANLPELEAMNAGRTPRFATGGMVAPRLVAPRMPALSNPASRAATGPTIPISIDARGAQDPAAVRAAAYSAIAEATPLIVQLAKGGTMTDITRQLLPGSHG